MQLAVVRRVNCGLYTASPPRFVYETAFRRVDLRVAALLRAGHCLFSVVR